MPSLPAWECGLKLPDVYILVRYKQSLPAWECGLKLPDVYILVRYKHVTPRVGVWIETFVKFNFVHITPSLPAWECGLKQTTAQHNLK